MIRRLDMWASTLAFCAAALAIELAANPSAPFKRRGYYGSGGYYPPQWRWKR